MLRATAIATALILLLLLPAVAIHADDVRKHRKEDLAKDTSEAYRSVKEHVKEMKEDLVDSLREKGVEFKKGSIEGESDARYALVGVVPGSAVTGASSLAYLSRCRVWELWLPKC